MAYTPVGTEFFLVETVQPNGMPSSVQVQVTLSAVAALASGNVSQQIITAISTVGAGTLTAAAVAGGIITRTGSTSAFSDTFDTAAAIIAALTNKATNQSFILTIRNQTAFAETVLTATGITLSGPVIIPPLSNGLFLVTVTAPTTISIAGLGAYDLQTNVVQALTTINTVGAGTLTAAGIAGGFISRTGTQIAAFTDTTDTAANIIAAIPNAIIGQSFEFTYQNNSVGGFIGTLTGGSGVTVSGATAVNPGNFVRYLVTYTAAATVTMVGVAGQTATVGFNNMTLSGLFNESATDTLTAVGTTQGGALALTTEVNRVTTAAASAAPFNGVTLPASAAGLTILVINKAANAIQVYGLASDKIDDQTATVGVTQMAGSMTLYTCATAGNWYSEGLGTGYSGSLQTLSFTDSITAHSGGTQALGVLLTSSINRISVAAALGDSVLLPVSAQGMQITIINNGAAPAGVFGSGTDTINGIATATGVLQYPNSVVTYSCPTVGKWVANLGGAYSGSLQLLTFTDAITAHSGGTQAAAVALTSAVNRVTTTAAIADSVALPTAVAGMQITVINSGANALAIYPVNAGADTINGLATTAFVLLGAGQSVTFSSTVVNKWVGTLPVQPAQFTSINVTTGTLAVGNVTGAAYVALLSTNATPGNQTPRTAAQMFNDTPGAFIGMSYMLRILNSGAGVFTLAAGATGVTLTGTMTIAQNTFRDFVVTFNTATTMTFQSLGTTAQTGI